jgi:HK97 family phage major capsid protein
MAMINELAPNTTEDHQGRLAYVPDDLLPPEIVGAIFEKAQETSLVLRMGERIPVSYGETVIPVQTKRPEVGQVGTGTSNAQREGGTKPLSGVAWDTRSFSPIKLATIVTVSEEFQRTNPQGFYSKIQNDLAFAISRGIDLAVFHGRQPLTGAALAGIDTDNVLNNTANVINLDTVPGPGNLYDELISGYEMVAEDHDFDGWAADSRFRARLIREGAERDVNGNLANPSAVNFNTTQGSILGFPVQYGKAVRGDLGAYAGSSPRTQMIGGDFSQLRWGFADEVRIKVSDQASLTDGVSTVSMWQTNQIALLIEVTFGWVVGDLDAFVKFTNPSTS